MVHQLFLQVSNIMIESEDENASAAVADDDDDECGASLNDLTDDKPPRRKSGEELRQQGT